jgi:hypothetical protein
MKFIPYWKGPPMGRNKKNAPTDDPPIAIMLRLPAGLHGAVHEAAQLLHIDMSNLLRMMISEHIGDYITRGKKGVESLAKARQPSAQTSEKEFSDPIERGDRGLDLSPP